MSQAPSSNSRPKVEDNKRIQKILDELSAKYSDRKNGMQQVVMDEKAKQMFMEYANELTVSVLEASSILAQHRNSKTIDVEDVALILGKRLGIELPGLAALKQQGPGAEGAASSEATPSSGSTPLPTEGGAAHNR